MDQMKPRTANRKAPQSFEELQASKITPHVLLPKGMLIPEEQMLLYLLGRDWFTGAGDIIDAGAFCGASAYALAAGLSDNRQVAKKDGRIHSYDLFTADEPYIVDFLQNIFYSRFDEQGNRVGTTRQVDAGESFLEVFLFQTQRYHSFVVHHPGTLLAERWTGNPVEVLFIDIAKTLDLQCHLVTQFFPCLIAQGSIVIQQDFHHPWHPYIHILMEYLRDYFEIILSAVGASRIYRLIKPIPRGVLARGRSFDFTNDEMIAFLSQMLKLAPVAERLVLSLVCARQLYILNESTRCNALIDEVMARYGDTPSADYLLGQLWATCPEVMKRRSAAAPVPASPRRRPLA